MSKETSVDVASKAGRLMAAGAADLLRWLADNPEEFAASVKAVAASALAQREDDGPALGSIEAAKLRQALVGIALDELAGRDCTSVDTAHGVKAAIDRRFGEFFRHWRRE